MYILDVNANAASVFRLHQSKERLKLLNIPNTFVVQVWKVASDVCKSF